MLPDNATVARSQSIPGTIPWLRVTGIRLVLTNLSHNFPDDLDFLLVGPDGRNLEFWSDAGGPSDIVNGTFTISDAGAASLPDSTAIASGTYRPADYTSVGGVETSSNWSGLASIAINHPGPAGSSTFASAFAGAWIPDTTYTLHVRDDEAFIGGSLGSWTLVLDYQTVQKPHNFDGVVGSDLLFQNDDGMAGIWTMNGFTALSVGAVGPNAPWPHSPGPDWHVKGDGDFNDDGRFDILWQNDDGARASG
jgi:hypothetical protein